MITIKQVTCQPNGDITLRAASETYSLPRKHFDLDSLEWPSDATTMALMTLAVAVADLQTEINELKERIASHG